MAEKESPPAGKRFTHVYADRGEPVGDSRRMRVRMEALLYEIEKLRQSGIMGKELGVEYRTWSDFFRDAPMRDILDLVTVGYDHLLGDSYHSTYDADRWRDGVQRIFGQENVHYRVDGEGGVHFQFDREFTHTTAAAISILERPRYANSLDAFSKALTALAQAPPDGKGAIRATFTAIEGLFILMFPEVRRLASSETSRLRARIEQVYNGDRRAQETSAKMLQSLSDWIDAAHGYRHEEGKPDTVAQPPLTLAVYLISTGAAHLRWLAELDSASGPAGDK
jgi:hypothetical protein